MQTQRIKIRYDAVRPTPKRPPRLLYWCILIGMLVALALAWERSPTSFNFEASDLKISIRGDE